MAEVSADDVRLDYDSDEPALQPIATAFDDNLGNGDGRWDAGETAGVLLTLKNFGSDASGVEATLACSDPLVTILDGAASFGDIPRGGTAGGTAPSFTVRASPHAPAGHVASCTLRIVHDSGESVSALGLTIGRHAVFVWDPTFLQSTGRALREILPSLGTPFTFSDLLPPNLEDHTLLFALLGVYPDNFVVRQVSSEATAIEPFFGDGHGVYLEGGDVWYFDPISMSGYPFAARFGLQAVEDGMADAGMVIGETGRFTEGMAFSYVGDNAYLDRLRPLTASFTILSNVAPVYVCGVAHDGGDYRTVGASIELGGLADDEPPSTKADLTAAILVFLRNREPQSGAGDAGSASLDFLGLPRPNPAARRTTISYSLSESKRVSISLVDAAGRRVAMVVDGAQEAGAHVATIDTGRLPAGVYFLRSNLGEGAGAGAGRGEGAGGQRKLIVTR